MFIALAFGICFLCQETVGKELTSSAGYKYILHTNSGNPKFLLPVNMSISMLNPGMEIKSLLQVENKDKRPYFQAGAEQNPNMPASPVEDVLAEHRSRR